MKKIILSVLAASAAIAAITAQNANDDPVAMSIDGRDVPLSEFEYLYNKNNNQQITPLTFDQYVEMFVNYKLKVADALNEKIDTTSSYRGEMSKFRRDLAQPFLRDSSVIEQLVMEAYHHNDEDVYVSHIMFSPEDAYSQQKLDSLRTQIINGVITFEEAASKYSLDKRSAVKGGLMGWVTGAGLYPWAFEKAAYDTPVHQLSEVINSGFGYHIVRPEKRRPAGGQVQVEHILLFTRGLDAAAAEKVQARIDSLYNVVIQPDVKFGDIARQYSQDRGSAAQNGLIDWFGPSQMVEEFDSVAFALNVGEISKPFKTQYGYHIVHKTGQRGNGSLEELRPKIEKAISSDARQHEPIKATIRKTANELGVTLNNQYKDIARKYWYKSGGLCDENCIESLRADSTVIFSMLGTDYTLGSLLATAPLRDTERLAEFNSIIEHAVETAYERTIMDYKIDQLYAQQPEYRNLYNEYRDGILLFDVSQKKIWDKASKDTKALTKYFKKNKKKYSNWEAPKYKAYVIFATTDSVADEIKNFIDSNYGKAKIEKINQEEFTSRLKEQFKGKIKVERVIAAKGENPITDYLGFGADKPENKSKNFETYFAFAGKVIEQPEEYIDVKGAVISDYQNELEQKWIKELRKKHKVVINNDVLQLAK